MNKEILIAWAAGLFEGEGSFQIGNNKGRGIVISSTDKDVLDRLRDNFGGNIYEITKRKSHWKDAWIWTVRKEEAIKFYQQIKPYLLGRRRNRGEEWFSKLPIKKDKSKLIELFKQGKTHQQIADELGLERSSVTKYLNRHNILR